MDAEVVQTQVLVLGSGAAGMCAALAAREAGADVLVASASVPEQGSATAVTQVAGAFVNSALGIADPADNPEEHFVDTVEAGQGLCEQAHVRAYVRGMLEAVPRLEGYGVRFRRGADGRWLQFRSAGNRFARTLSYGPGERQSLSAVLVEAGRRAGVRFHPYLTAQEILVEKSRAIGVVAWDAHAERPVVVSAGGVVLATGGAGLLYPRTGIPPLTTGAGYAMALAAGCSLIDMELVQWYPTALAEDRTPPYLLQYEYFLTHGAVLRNAAGEDILRRHLGAVDPQLVTRDQLSVALGREVQEGRLDRGRAFLDLSSCRSQITHPVLRDSPYVRLVGERLGRPGGGVYVAPIAHYFMGGVQADAEGRTEVAGLYACGEVVGGVHGANRLQGNSLMDCIVAGFSSGALAAREGPAPQVPEATRRHARELAPRAAEMDTAGLVEALRDLMARSVGLVRDGAGLASARDRLRDLAEAAGRLAGGDRRQRQMAAVLPLVLLTARTIVAASLERGQSIGAYYRTDSPEGAPEEPYHTRIRLADGRLVSDRVPVDRCSQP